MVSGWQSALTFVKPVYTEFSQAKDKMAYDMYLPNLTINFSASDEAEKNIVYTKTGF